MQNEFGLSNNIDYIEKLKDEKSILCFTLMVK